MTQFGLTGNVFIRPSDVRRNVVFGRDGAPKEPERSLAYFIAHEVTHAMTADRIGRLATHRLAAFQREGYADYVAFARPVDFRAGRAALVRGDARMSPSRSGLYARYELLTAYVLERRGMTPDELLGAPLRQRDVEAALLADRGL